MPASLVSPSGGSALEDPPLSSSGGSRRKAARYRDLACGALITATVLVALTFRDYGITHDEEVQNIYGEKLVSYYATRFVDKSAFNYLDLHRYGGIFDVVSCLVNRVSPFGVYETRHFLGGMIGVVALLGAWKLGRLLAGDRAGLLALSMLALTPSFLGLCFNDPKDAPFATAMLWTTYYLCKAVAQLPAPRWSTILKLGVSFGCALGSRVGAVVVVPYLALGLGLHLVETWRRTRSATASRREAWMAIRRLAPSLGIAYGVMALFWPWAVQSPLNPIGALRAFANAPIDLDTLIDGKWVLATQLPARYLPEYLSVKLPEMVLAGLLVGSVLTGLPVLRRRESSALGVRTIQIVLVVVAALSPVFFFVLFRPAAYNGIRHFLFVVPPLVVLAAASLDRLWVLAQKRSPALGRLLATVIVVGLTFQVWVVAKLHPDEYVYFNFLAGGLRGARGRFEIDYWSNSLAEASRALARYLQMESGEAPVPRVYKVAVCGNGLSASYYFPPYMLFTEDPTEADFAIAFTQHDCSAEFEGRQIIAIERFGVPLSVVRDRREVLGRPLN